MEFFRTVPHTWDEGCIQAHLTVAELARYCDFIDRVLRHDGDEGEIYCGWGQFKVLRQAIKGGVRFVLPGCPNALAWTVTAGYPPALGGITIHGTINRTEHALDFVETIDEFMDSWAEGLGNASS
ncbi:MAG: hypothetical protein HQL53_13875 [Magnetococcales bacterium]|nr:hypothetical protein [Magnetococcales bacterium]